MKIGIVGLGLIGGSLGIDFRSHNYTVLGVSRSLETCQTAIKIGAVDDATTDLEFVAQTDLIFICTPLDRIIPTLQQLIPYLRPTTIVTDVGSVKASIVYPCSQLWTNFVGGHPMAGTAGQGIADAQTKLFVNRPYVLTPIATIPPESVKILENVVRSIGANLFLCTPEAHDRSVAWISHLPVIVSASLIQACMSESDLGIRQLSQNLASSGFASTSRVGGGNPELGVLMAQYNQEALLRSLHQFQEHLNCLITDIKAENWTNLGQSLESTRRDRSLFVRMPQFNREIGNRVIFTLSFFLFCFCVASSIG
jgi:arogenate dehydrogenase (NADP+)